MIMSANIIEPVASFEEKTRELCQHLLDDPTFVSAQERIEAFESCEEAQELYHAWQTKTAELHHLHHQGRQPSQADIVEVERLKEAVMDNAVAFDFVEAEDSLNLIFSTVMKMVQKTLQNGRIPTEEELHEHGCCGGGSCGSC